MPSPPRSTGSVKRGSSDACLPSTTRSSRSRASGWKTLSAPVTSRRAASSGAASVTYWQPTLPGLGNATSSPELEHGVTHSDSQAGPMISTSGQDPVPASPSARRDESAERTTTAISGPSGSGSSASAALQSFLGSRLRALTDSRGSTLFVLTWKERVTPSGLRICALRASVRRTSGSGSGSLLSDPMQLRGWPTTTKEDSSSSARHGYMIKGLPGTTLFDAARLAGWATPVSTEIGNTLENYTAMNMTSGARTAITHPSLQAQLTHWPTSHWATPAVHDTTGAKTPEQIEAMRARAPKREGGGPPGISNLNEQATLSAWATPTVADSRRGAFASEEAIDKDGRGGQLPTQATLSQWGTPVSRDWKGTGRPGQVATTVQLAASGPTSSGPPAETAPTGQLNPALSRWLMGLPPAWDDCVPTVTRSSRTSRKPSSKP
jgi:hypothetical protein